MLKRHNGVEEDPEGAFVYYDEHEAELASLRAWVARQECENPQTKGIDPPTLEELESVLNSAQKVPIEILPNGEVRVKEGSGDDCGECLPCLERERAERRKRHER